MARTAGPRAGLNSGAAPAAAGATLAGPRGGRRAVPFELELACNDPFGFGEAGQGAAATFGCGAARSRASTRRRGAVERPRGAARRSSSTPGVEPAWAGPLLAELHAFTLDGDRARLARLLARPSGELHRMSAIGHAHLDTAWLWPLEETWRKLVRTVTAQLRLHRRVSRAPLRPLAGAALRVAARSARRSCSPACGRRSSAGSGSRSAATWVEPDCNLPSGESLARQFLYGQRWFEQHLGPPLHGAVAARRVRLRGAAARS